MRFSVIAADRAATIATTIHKTCLSVGQPCKVARAASNAPVSANGSANTECSNLIISRTVRIFPAIGELRLRLFGRCLTGPAKHLFLWQADLRQDAAKILPHQIVNRFWMMVKRRDRGHDDCAGLLRAQHVFEMDAVERRIAHAEDQLAVLL